MKAMYLLQATSQNISEIIKAASQSKLGIASLVIVALSIVGVILFRKAPVRVQVAIFVMLLVGLMGFAFAMTQAPSVSQPDGQKKPTPAVSPDSLTKCIEEQTKEIEQHPKNASAFYNRGSCYHERKGSDDQNKAIDDYNEVIRIYQSTSTERADIYQNRGNAYEARGQNDDLDKAIADYSHAIELTQQGKAGNSNRLDLLKDRGYAYDKNGLRNRMIEDFRTICREAPKSNQCSDVRPDIQ